MRYEGIMYVRGFVHIVVDEPGLTIEEAKAKAQARPESYSILDVEALEFDTWETDLKLTENESSEEDEDFIPDEEDDGYDEGLLKQLDNLD